MVHTATGIALVAVLFASGLDAHQITDRWAGSTASGSAGVQGDPIDITWSLVPDLTPIPAHPNDPDESSDPSSLISFMDGMYGSGPGGSDLTQRPWFSIFDDSFGRFSELSGITFVYEPNDDGSDLYTVSNGNAFGGPTGLLGVRGDVRIGGHSIDGQSGSNTLAYNFFPNTADMVIDTDNINFFKSTTNNSRAARDVIMHEAGHGLGFSHVVSTGSSFLMEPTVSSSPSIDGPQFDDILALHRSYGDINEKSNGGAGNDVFSNATTLGFISDGAFKSIGTDAGDTFVAATDVDFVSIDGTSDVDYFSFIVATASEVDLTLTPMGPTYNEGPQNGSESSFNSAAKSDLTLEILDIDGTTSLGLANAGGLGVAELLNDVYLDSGGMYYVRISGADDAAQFYELDISVVTVPEPWSLSLAGVATLLLTIFALRRHKRKAAN